MPNFKGFQIGDTISYQGIDYGTITRMYETDGKKRIDTRACNGFFDDGNFKILKRTPTPTSFIFKAKNGKEIECHATKTSTASK